ncbi:MAG: cupin domain-containing protein [Candidatus Omnitrophota bacterium]
MKNPSYKIIKLEDKDKYQRLINKDLGSFGLKSGHVILSPGESVGEHTTGDREEIVVVIRGNGEAIVDKDNMLNIDQSSVLYIPPKMIHDIKNTGQEALEYIYVTSETFQK